MEDRLEISNSKNKTIGLTIFGALLTFIGYTQSLFGLVYFSKGISYIFLGIGVLVLIGGVVSIFASKGPAIILTNEGLNYNPKINAFVKWTEVAGFTDYNLNNHHTILVRLKDVNAFIEKQEDEKLKNKMTLALKVRETPIAIDPFLLEISRSKLNETLHEYLVKYGNN